MQGLSAKRTLVKSQPELWEELSEVERLAKHLGAFGEIKITRLEPEHKVAWEGEHASGTVSIEPSGWGTKVVLTAELAADPDPPQPGDADASEPVEEVEDPPAEASETEAAPDEEPAVPVDEPCDEGDPVWELASEPVPTSTMPTPAAEQAPRRRRGFWSRLFAGWFMPEERLHKTSFRAPDPPILIAPADDSAAVPDEEAPTADTLTVEVEPTRGEEPPEDVVNVEQPTAIDQERARSVLEETLEALGSAHHRPFSRG